MLNEMLRGTTGILSAMIEKEPSVIMGPIDAFLGYILDFIFNIVYHITEPNALGITIIIFTLLTRCLMIPSGIKSQKSMFIMKKLQPDLDKIKAKYPSGSKDPEIQRKMSAEMQALYAKNNYNPLGGCLPIFITLPIFMALSYLLRQPFMFVERIGTIYESLAMQIMQSPNYVEIIKPLANAHVPNNMAIDISLVSDLVKALNKFTSAEWDTIMAGLTGPSVSGVAEILGRKTNFETFLGLNLLNTSGWAFPGILIPLFSAATSFLQSFINFKMNPPQDANSKSMQMMMMIFMPLFMGYITVGISMGVGIYWITGNIFFVIQQLIITKYLKSKQAV